MIQPIKKTAITTYLSEGYKDLFLNFLESFAETNKNNFKHLDFHIYADNNLSNETKSEIMKRAFDYGITLLIVGVKMPVERFESLSKAPYQNYETLQYTYYKLESLELLKTYDFLIFCDSDILVKKEWDLSYLQQNTFDEKDKKDLFGFDHSQFQGGHIEINTGFCILRKSLDHKSLHLKAIIEAKKKAYHLPDQHILNLLYGQATENCRMNGKMSERYNDRNLNDDTINHHGYGKWHENKKH